MQNELIVKSRTYLILVVGLICSNTSSSPLIGSPAESSPIWHGFTLQGKLEASDADSRPALNFSNKNVMSPQQLRKTEKRLETKKKLSEIARSKQKQSAHKKTPSLQPLLPGPTP